MAEIPKLTEEQWKECSERLTLYATQKFFCYGWKGNDKRNERIGPKAISPQDLAAEAIISVIQGNRCYNPESYPDFMTFLRSIVDSQINHLAKSAEHRKKKPLVQEAYENADNPVQMEFTGNEPDPSRTCINKELVEKLKESLAPAFNKDKIIREIFECLEAGITTDRDMAELLEVNVQEIYKAKKRFRRKVDKIKLD